jgi:hypothetical protein
MLYAEVNGKSISANEFSSRFARAHLNGEIIAKCLVCGRKVDPYGLHSTRVNNRYDHPNGVRDCPLSSANDERYKHLNSSTNDEGKGRSLRRAFLREGSLRSAYAFSLKVCGKGSLSGKKYGELIKIADGIGIWGYVGLPSWTVPFILLTLADFEATTYNFSFRLQKSRSQPTDDLWLDPKDSKLEKIFPNGTPMDRAGVLENPIPICEKIYREVALDNDWVNDKVLSAVRRTCLQF